MNDGQLWAPPIIGFNISLSLYGVTLAQSIFYFLAFPDDSLRAKVLVAVLSIIDSIHVVMVSWTFWFILVKRHANENGATTEDFLFQLPWPLMFSVLITYIMSFIVHFFLGRRAYRVASRNRLTMWIIASAALMQLVFGVTLYVKFYSIHDIATNGFTNTAEYRVASQSAYVLIARLCIFQMIAGFICDAAIATTLVRHFYRSRIGTQRADTVLQYLIALSITTGLIPCVASLIGLFLKFSGPGWFPIGISFNFILGKLHVNSFLATINARKQLRAMVNKTVNYSISTIPTETKTGTEQTGPWTSEMEEQQSIISQLSNLSSEI